MDGVVPWTVIVRVNVVVRQIASAVVKKDMFGSVSLQHPLLWISTKTILDPVVLSLTLPRPAPRGHPAARRRREWRTDKAATQASIGKTYIRFKHI